MQHHTSIITAAIIAATGTVASADIVRVDEFNSIQFEGFENTSAYLEYGEVSVFSGAGQASNTNGSWVHTAGSDLYRFHFSPFEGNKQFGALEGGIQYSFVDAQKSFGGYFANLSEVDDGQVRFYNGQTLIGSDTLSAPSSREWTWNGWSSDVEFDRVEIESNAVTMGYLLHDAIRILSTQTPAPGGAALAFGGLLVIARRKR